MTARAVLFDLDGTLIDSEPTHHRALIEILAREGLSVPDGFDRKVTGLSVHEVYDLLVGLTGQTLDRQRLVADQFRIYRRLARDLVMRPNAEKAFTLVRAFGAAVAVVSNSDRLLVEANLEAIDLFVPGLVSVSRNDVRRGKPSPESYLRAAWLLGMEPRDCVVVEDSVTGTAAGLAAGMAVIGWPEPQRTDLVYPAGTILADPDNLCEALEDLLRRPPS